LGCLPFVLAGFLLAGSPGALPFVSGVSFCSHFGDCGRAGCPNGALSSGTAGRVYGVVSGGELRVDDLSAAAAVLRGPRTAMMARVNAHRK
jgi:hypothetical protein